MQNELKVMRDLELGDLTVKDDQALGFSVYTDDGKLIWINQKGEESLLEWLNKKHQQVLSVNVKHDQSACEVGVSRMLSEKRAANMG